MPHDGATVRLGMTHPARRRRVAATSALAVFASLLVAPPGPGAASPASRPTYSLACAPARPGVLNAAPAVRGATRTVALTFDDGPGASTGAILTILRREGVRATFFNVGQSVREHPDLVRREANDGFLLGDHTNSHPDLVTLSHAAQSAEIDQVAVREHQLTGEPICVFRPPYGSFNLTTRRVVATRALSLWTWSIGTGDWMANGSGSSYWVSYIERAVVAGAAREAHPVVLLHNQRRANPATVRALPTIIRYFRSHHYTFVDLLGRTGAPGACGRRATPVVAATTRADPLALGAGESLASPGGQFALSMSASGVLSLAEPGGPVLWSAPGGAVPGARATFANGVLRVVDPNGSVLWSVGVPGAATLRLGADGELALVEGGRVEWSSHTLASTLHPGEGLAPGWRLWSANRRCVLTMTASGALTLTTADHQVLWTNAVRAPGGRTVLGRDGNLVTLDARGRQVWSSATPRHPHDALAVTNTGRVLISDASGDHLWATP